MAATSSLDHLSNRMKLEWHSKLNTEMVPAKNFRRTSIIGTIGPKTNSVEKINALRTGTNINLIELFFGEDRLTRL
jgi:pyruvate kinase